MRSQVGVARTRIAPPVNVLIGVVLAVAGYQYWQNEQAKAGEAASVRYAAGMALVRDGKFKEAIKRFKVTFKQKHKLA